MPKVSTSFKKGQSGNPNGAPKREWTMRGLIEQAMEAQTADGVSMKIHVAAKLVSMAGAGDIVAIKEVNQRLDGMPQVDITSGGEAIKGPQVFIPKEVE